MSEHDKGFTVVDRRASAASEEAAEPAASPASADFDFSLLVQSIAITALHHLGAVPDPEATEQGTQNLPLARQNIEILEILEAKTRGNLDAAEAHLLTSLLYEVRMRYVEASKATA